MIKRNSNNLIKSQEQFFGLFILLACINLSAEPSFEGIIKIASKTSLVSPANLLLLIVI